MFLRRRKVYWLVAAGACVGAAAIAINMAASRARARFEPMVRDEAIKYLSSRFHCDVQLAELHIHLPKMSTLQLLWNRQPGAKVRVDGQDLAMRFPGRSEPLFAIRRFGFQVDLNGLLQDRKTVDSVTVEGMQINLPPKGQHAQTAGVPADPTPNILVKDVRIKDATLVILPRDPDRVPLRFPIESLHLMSVGANEPMQYEAALTIPKPPGKVSSSGRFGPWSAAEPGDTPLEGAYTFNNADLGIFNGIAGTLTSEGSFDGSLAKLHATGKASVPNFELKSVGHPTPLSTRFECLVDGTNGNTILQPVRAKLGDTYFTTTGAVVKHEGARRRAISLRVIMPDGDLRQLLRFASKTPELMEGRIALNTRIDIPPLTGRVAQKLLLDGRFALKDAKFLNTTIQNKIDELSRRGQGHPKDVSIDEVVSNMAGSFRLEHQKMTFRSLSFEVPGADVDVAGDYDMDAGTVDMHGALKLEAKVSQTVTGWKRWALKPVDPFFSKNGAGTFLRIAIDGSAHDPHFGLDRHRGEEGEAARSIQYPEKVSTGKGNDKPISNAR